MMTNVVQMRGGGIVTKQQLADHLGRSTRWIELRVNEGMPSEHTDRRGRRMFNVADVEAWLAAGERRTVTITERLGKMETELAELREHVRTLERERKAS
jgi:hypothetical protein